MTESMDATPPSDIAAAYSARMEQAKHYLDLGDSVVNEANYELAANPFRSAAEILLAATAEAAGFSMKDVSLWEIATDGRSFIKDRDPDYSLRRRFLVDLGLLTDEDYERYEVIRKVGNAASHGQSSERWPEAVDVLKSGKAVYELYDGALSFNIQEMFSRAKDVRKQVFGEILRAALATDRVKSRIARRQNEEDLNKDDRDRLEKDRDSLEAMNVAAIEYYEKTSACSHDYADGVVHAAMVESVKRQMEGFDSKAAFIARMEKAITGKEDFIARRENDYEYFEEVERAKHELSNMYDRFENTTNELDRNIESIRATFDKASALIGEETTRKWREWANDKVRQSGYSGTTFSTAAEIEQSERALEEARARARAGAKEDAKQAFVLLVVLVDMVLFVAGLIACHGLLQIITLSISILGPIVAISIWCERSNLG